MTPQFLYHWSPVKNRASIKKLGLVPHRKAIDGSWRPPYLCFATSPMQALNLVLQRTTAFDLYQIDTRPYLFWQRKDWPSEWRTGHRIFKRHVKLVATLTNCKK
jgi:hypothetical protein